LLQGEFIQRVIMAVGLSERIRRVEEILALVTDLARANRVQGYNSRMAFIALAGENDAE
jgi:hypothetical protein